MCEKLKLLYSVTDMFSGTQHPTANLFPKVCEIKLLLDDCLLSPIEAISTTATKVVDRFHNNCLVIHGILTIATVLDPRFELKLIEYYFPKIYGSDSAKEIERARKIC